MEQQNSIENNRTKDKTKKALSTLKSINGF